MNTRIFGNEGPSSLGTWLLGFRKTLFKAIKYDFLYIIPVHSTNLAHGSFLSLLYSSYSLLSWESFALLKSLCFFLHILWIAWVIQGRCLVFALSSLGGTCFDINLSRKNLSESKFSETDRDPTKDRQDSLNFTASVFSFSRSAVCQRCIRRGCCLFIRGLMEQSVRTMSWSETPCIDMEDFTSPGLLDHYPV